MTLQIVGAGFGRTGTLSMKAALERLGYSPCYHMVEVIQNPLFADRWIAAAEGRAVDWDIVFKGYKAAVDWPACAFYREIAAHFPNAKVILTVRDMQSWYESCRATIFGVMRLDPKHMPPHIAHAAHVGHRIVTEKTFAGRLDDSDYCIAVHREHIEAVQRAISPERLLVFDVRDGWVPLCRFLNVAVPDEPFPRANEREEFGKYVNR